MKDLVEILDHMKEEIMLMEIIISPITISVILLLLGIVVLIMIHVCVVGRAFRRGFGDGVLQRGSLPNIRAGGLTPHDLNKLPCFEYREGEKGTNTTSSSTTTTTTSSPTECAVCLDNFKLGDKCRVLPHCEHCFHVSCVDLWLIKSPLCPICRAPTKPPSKVCSDVGEGSNV